MNAAHLLYVAAGGAIGASARYLVGVAALRVMGPDFPWGTLLVNVGGSFAMGLAAHWLISTGDSHIGARVFLMTGILGGFTTFSAYALDIVVLAERGAIWPAAAYALVSVAGSVGALIAGLALARALAG